MTAFVYTFRASDGSVLYVGCTQNIGQRICHHQARTWWPEVAKIESVAYPDLTEGRFREAEQIRALQPVHNTLMTDNNIDGGNWATRRANLAAKAAAS